jgi:para-nitrobenzyl esterase
MEVEIDTPQGRLRGLRRAPGVDEFRRIPYAEPPVGPWRFRAPRPAQGWDGVRDAARAGPSPVQSGSSIFAGSLPGNTVAEVDEDCLTVDVWTPRAGDGSGRPVLVWICGGAYLTGGSAIETYDGATLASTQDIVVVSVNYRLGALGFLWVDGGDSNCGLRDQMEALRWTARHAEAFGGDPARITVFGESAGAGSILHFLPAAAREGLVRRAIIQSAGVEHTQTEADATRVKEAVSKAAGLSQESELYSVPWPALLDAQEEAALGLMATVSAMPFHPVVDGDVVRTKPAMAWEVPGVEVMFSWTAEEMRLYPDRATEDRERLLRRIRGLIEKRTGADPGEAAARRVADFYADRGPGPDVWAAIQTDALMRLPARRVAGFEGVEPHVAQFDWGATGGDWRRGAFHAIDLPFTFGTLDRCGWLEFLGAAGVDDRGAHRVADAHMAAWAEFARSGNPGWGRFPDELMHFAAEPWVGGDPLLEAAAAWEGLWSADGPPM